MGTLLIFLIVFLPVGWGLWRLLRFTRDTIGTHSPLKVQRIYRTTTWSFFRVFDYLFVIMALTMGVVLIYAVLFSSFSMSNPNLARAVFLIMSLVVLCLGIVVPIVDINHWKYAHNVEITTFPEEHEVEITLPDRVLRLRNGDLDNIRSFSNDAKLQLGFTEFYLTNGDLFTLSHRTEGLWVIEEYFKGVPVVHVTRHIPLIGKRSEEPYYKNYGSLQDKPRQAWAVMPVVFLLGVCMLGLTYGMYADAKWEDDMATHTPVVCMKILYGTRGAGTMKYPDKIYAEYQGKTYHFDMGRKYFRSLLGVDTIAVYYDEASGKAFLPTRSSRVGHYAFLYFLIGGCGLGMIGGSVWELVRLSRWRRTLNKTVC